MKRLTFIVLMLMGTFAWANAPAKVLLLPFESVGPVEKDWVAKALQQNLVAELARVNSVQAVTGDHPASAMDAALKAAGEANADYVVFGSYQSVDGDLRMTGQVIDVSKKQAVAGLKTTGSQRDLFGMEDVIAHQIKRALPQPVAEAHPEMLQQPPAAPPAIEPNGPVVINDANLRAQELQDQIDRAIDRIRYAPPDYYDYYPSSYGYYPYYSSVYYVPVFGGHRHHDHHTWGGGTSISGSYHSEHFNGNFRIGGGSGGHNHAAPTGNFVSSGRNFVQTTAGSGMGARR
jgi:TolB-like protein